MITCSKSLKKNPKDPNAPKKCYASVQIDKTYPLEEFARHIADHGSTYSRADITAVLILAVDCMHELLLAGAQVQLGDLGTFRTSVRCTAADSAEEFSVNNIKQVKVLWKSGSLLKDLKKDAEIRFVPTRQAVNAVNAAINANEGSVNITLPTTGSTGGDNGGSTGGNGGNGGTSSDDTGGNQNPTPGGSGGDGGID